MSPLIYPGRAYMQIFSPIALSVWPGPGGGSIFHLTFYNRKMSVFVFFFSMFQICLYRVTFVLSWHTFHLRFRFVRHCRTLGLLVIVFIGQLFHQNSWTTVLSELRFMVLFATLAFFYATIYCRHFLLWCLFCYYCFCFVILQFTSACVFILTSDFSKKKRFVLIFSL